MSNVLPYGASALVTVPASSRIACYSDAPYTVEQVQSFPNYPDSVVTLFSGVGAFTSATFTAAANIVLRGGTFPLLYSVGTNAVVRERNLTTQGDPSTLNATGTLTAAMVLSGIVTSTTAAAVTATLDTGTIFDAAATWPINSTLIWSVINTGPNTFTVQGAAGHTVVGAGAVATATSGRFMTRKTAANTFVTYRL